MTPGRARAIIRSLPRADSRTLHELYVEVYGADFAGQVTEDRARASIHSTLVNVETPCFSSSFPKPSQENAMETPGTETPAATTSMDDLVGSPTTAAAPAETAPAAEAKPAKAKKAKRPGIATASKKAAKVAKPKAEKKLFTPKVIHLRDPEIKRNKDGKITSIVGKCCWKEGGKFTCDKPRTIHAADAFQVRYCKEHKKEAQKLARRKASKAKK